MIWGKTWYDDHVKYKNPRIETKFCCIVCNFIFILSGKWNFFFLSNICLRDDTNAIRLCWSIIELVLLFFSFFLQFNLNNKVIIANSWNLSKCKSCMNWEKRIQSVKNALNLCKTFKHSTTWTRYMERERERERERKRERNDSPNS